LKRVKIRAERLLGEMLAQTEDSKPGPKQLGSTKELNSNPTLEEIGVDKKLSMRSQQLASVPLRTFEEALSAQHTAGTINVAPRAC
jgi:hypothetical protein